MLIQFTYFGDSLIRLTEGQPVPTQVVSSLAVQIDDSLVAACTIHRANRFLREHSVISVNRPTSLISSCRQLLLQVVQLHTHYKMAILTSLSIELNFFRVDSLSANISSKLRINSFNLSISVL